VFNDFILCFIILFILLNLFFLKKQVKEIALHKLYTVMSKYICNRCNKDLKQKSNYMCHKNRIRLCKSIEEQEIMKKNMEDNEKIALINEVKDLRTIKGLQEKIIEQDIEIKKLKEENEKLRNTKTFKKTLTPIELKEEADKQLQLRREANKKMVDEAPDDEYPNEQEKLRHLQWLNDLAKAELESDSDDTKDTLDYSSEEEPPPKPKTKRIIKKSVYSDSDSD